MDVLATEEVIIKSDMLDSVPLADMVVAHDHGHGHEGAQNPHEQDEREAEHQDEPTHEDGVDQEEEQLDVPRLVLKETAGGGAKTFLVQNAQGGNQPTQIYIIQTSDGNFATLPVITTDGDDEDVVMDPDSKKSGTTSLVLQSAAGGGNTQVFETVSALEQLARGGDEEVEVYEEVVLPDGDQLVDVAEVEVGGNGEITLASTASSAPPSKSARSSKPSASKKVPVVRVRQQGSTGAQGSNDLVCPDCFKVFKSKRSLFGHRKEKHSGVTESHPCPECGKTFGRKSNLKAHRESLHYGKKFPCHLCERVFTNRSSRNQHVKKTHHQGTKVVVSASNMVTNNGSELTSAAVRGNVIVLSDIVGNSDGSNVVINTSTISPATATVGDVVDVPTNNDNSITIESAEDSITVEGNTIAVVETEDNGVVTECTEDSGNPNDDPISTNTTTMISTSPDTPTTTTTSVVVESEPVSNSVVVSKPTVVNNVKVDIPTVVVEKHVTMVEGESEESAS